MHSELARYLHVRLSCHSNLAHIWLSGQYDPMQLNRICKKTKVIKADSRILIKVLVTFQFDMRAVINTSAPSLGEEGTKTIEDLKIQLVLMEEENINLLNEEKIPHMADKASLDRCG